MSKEKSEKNGLNVMLKRVLPIIIGIALILAIGIIFAVSKNAKKKNPVLSNGNVSYLQFDKLNITNQQLYDKMKKDYGLSELTRLIDEKIFAEEIAKVNIDSEEYIKYVEDSLFEDEDDEETMDEEWDSFVESLAVNGVISPSEAEASKGKREDKTCAAWKAIKESYRLQYAKNEWAKREYLAQLLSEKQANGQTDLFTDEEIETEYNSSLTTDITGIFIPFTSETSAKDLMKEVGINVDALEDIKDRWVRGEYEYSADDSDKKNPLPNDYLTDAEVVKLCIAMYNKVLAYYNNGEAVIPSDALKLTFSTKKTLELVEEQLTAQMALYSTVNGNLELPLTAKIKGLDKTVSITWKIVDSEGKDVNEDGEPITYENFKLIEENGKMTVQVVTTDSSQEFKVKAILSLDEEIIGKEDTEKDTIYTIKVTKPSEDSDAPVETKVITLPEMNQVNDWEVTGLNNDLGNKHSVFVWKSDDSSDMGKYMNSTLKLTSFNNSYTTSPATIGKYTCIAIKLSETEKVEYKDLSDEEKATATEETRSKLTEALYTGDNSKQLDRLYYVKRQELGLKIYDHYMQAIYKYGYESCYSSLSIKDYPKFAENKKTSKTIVAKTDNFEITTDELFKSLEPKYGATATLTFINQYLVLKDNKQYNPWTGEIDKKYVKNAIKADVAPYEYYFANDYFNGIYGYYYFGVTPAFPASYGWNSFLKDLYGIEDEKDLLISSNIFNTSGRIYNNSLQDYLNKVLKYEDMLKIMNEKWEQHYKVDVMNFLIYVDFDYDGTADTAIVESNAEDVKEENWTEETKALAQELAKLVMDRSSEADTEAKDKAAELKKVVELYNDAPYRIIEPTINEDGTEELALKDSFGKYKLAGLQVKFEDVATYSQNDSLVEEFHQEMKKLWDYGKSQDFIENPVEEPVLYSAIANEYAFETSFGYHAVAVKNFYEPIALPTEQEINLYKTMGKIDAAKENIENAQEYAENYQQLESMAASYRAQIKLSEQILEEETAKLKELLGNPADFNIDTYTLPAEMKEKCEEWYENDDTTTPVQEYISKVIAIDLINTIYNSLNTIVVGSDSKQTVTFNKDQFKYYIEYLQDEYKTEE